MPLDALASFEPLSGADASHSAADHMAIKVRMPDGGWLQPDAVAGELLSQSLVAFGIAINGDGHVRVPAAWRTRLPTPTASELARLKEMADTDETSRLASKIVMTAALRGLELELAPGSLIPQTYWIAG